MKRRTWRPGRPERKKKRLILTVMIAIFLTAGCKEKENRYTYRDDGIEALNKGDLEGAITAFETAIELSKGRVGAFEVDVLSYRAEAEYRLGDYAAASHTYDILLQVDEERPEYYYMRCASRAGKGDYAGALEDYSQASRLDTERTAPGRMTALLAAGSAAESQGDETGAMQYYKEAGMEGMESAELWNRMGLCKMGEADYEEAIKYFDQGIAAQDSPQVPILFYNKAVAYERMGDFHTALKLMEQYIALAGSDEEAEREIAFLRTR